MTTPAAGRGPVLYGRRRGRPLRPGRRRLMESLLPRLAVTFPALPGGLDPLTLFGPQVREVWLEIGFGAGEHLAAQARARADVGFLGAEPFVNGVAALLAEIAGDDLTNIRIHPGDGRALLAALQPASIGRAFVLFPDPWPKSRHAKRRFLSGPNLDALARVLADGAELRLATDDPGHVGWIMARAHGHPAFAWVARRPGDWRRRPADWPPTRYERKAVAAGRRPVFLRFRRRPRQAGR